jgi:hypothetical protein
MANILTSLRNGIQTRMIGTDNTFRTSILQTVSTVSYYKLYFHIAPQQVPGTQTDVTLPYVVWDMLPINYDFDTVNEFNDITIQFRVSGLSSAGVEAVETIMGLIHDRFKDCEADLSISGYKVVVIRTLPIFPPFLTDNVWNGVLQYSLQLQKN